MNEELENDCSTINATNLQVHFQIACHDKIHIPPVRTFVNIVHSTVVASTPPTYSKKGEL